MLHWLNCAQEVHNLRSSVSVVTQWCCMLLRRLLCWSWSLSQSFICGGGGWSSTVQPERQGKNKKRRTSLNLFLICFLLIGFPLNNLSVSLQVFIFTVDNSRLRIVFELPGKEVGHEYLLTFFMVQEYYALKQMSSCSLGHILAPVSPWWIWTLMACQTFWLGLLWQQATPERREKYMCTSTRDR